jgi:hypothetical protein
VQRFAGKPASLLWFFIGYWILKTRLGFYPASLFITSLINTLIIFMLPASSSYSVFICFGFTNLMVTGIVLATFAAINYFYGIK